MNTTVADDETDRVDEHFPTRLRILRRQAGLTKKDLADLTCGRVNRNTLARWENRSQRPTGTSEGFRIVAAVLGVPPGFLAWGNTNEEALAHAGGNHDREGGAGGRLRVVHSQDDRS